MFRIFLTNLGKYNEGELVGEWIDLPVNDDFEEAFEKIGINDRYEEWFITDYESDIHVHVDEYEDIFKLNQLAEEIEYLRDYELEIVGALIDNGYDIEEAIENVNNVIVYNNCCDMTDVAMEYCEQCGILSMVPDDLQMYFDFEAYGRDMNAYGNFFYYDGNYYEILM